ncbi:MAG: hypothetical protein LIO74_11180 [Ruminococcus sp.]|nr:hypothetical protein [Ruminococcus sp.]
MQKEEKHKVENTQSEETSAKNEKHKKKKGKSLLETMREIDKKEAQQEAEREERLQEQIAKKEQKEREAYEKKIQQDRIELIRLKQGVIEESETIHEEKEEKPKLSFWKRISNFFYHSKWWLWITVFIVAIFGFLAYDYITKVRPDIIVMVLTDDSDLQLMSEELETYFEQFTDDENSDGKIQVDIYMIPVTDDIATMDYYTGNATKLSTQMMLGDAVMVLTDAKANEYIIADETLENMEDLYPNDSNAREQGYYLRHTDFATQIGYEGKVDRDLSLGLRTVTETYDSVEDMQENYDIAKKVLDRIVESLQGTEEPEDVTETTESETEAE